MAWVALAACAYGVNSSFGRIVIDKYKNEAMANSSIEGFNDILQSEPTLTMLKEKHSFVINKKQVEGGEYMVFLEPFYDDEVLANVYYSIKRYFPNAIVTREKSPQDLIMGEETQSKIDNYHKPNQTKTVVITQDSSTIYLWIIIVLLMIISGGIFYYYTRHIKIVQEEYQKIVDKNAKLEESQNLLLATVSQRIKESVETMVAEREKFFNRSVDELSTDIIKRTSSRFKDADELLLDTTSDLIIFLQLKSKKIEAVAELFNINNILNEISGQILQKHKNRNIELIFDVNNNVPQLLVGDSNHISKVLLNIFEQALKTTRTGEIKLMIDTLSMQNDDINIEIKIIDNGEGIEEKWLSKLFVPFSSENITQMDQDNLGLYIAKELIFLMGGEIRADSKHGEGNIFTIKLPLKIDKSTQVAASSQSRLGVKKVLIIEKNDSASWALEKILRYFGYDTTIKPSNHLGDKISELIYFDILAIDISLVSHALAQDIESVKTKSNLKIIGLSSLLQEERIASEALAIIDRHLIKPLHRERVYEVLANIFSERYNAKEHLNLRIDTTQGIQEQPPQEEIKSITTPDEATKETSSPQKHKVIEPIKYIPRVYKGEIHDAHGINKSDFIVFRGARLLIVEDNTINQKVILRVLKKSGIKIDVANNGEEAIRLLEHQNGEYDFILMDISMPIMDGYGATRIIRSNEMYDHIPIVSLTSLGLDHEIKKMYESGMNACLIKPLKMGQLYSVFSLFLKKQNALDTSHMEANEEEEYEEEYEPMDYIEDSAILDTKSGIVYSRGNEVLYIEILKEFLEVYSNNFEQFKEYIENEEYDNVLSLARDMSGLAGAIGANNMTHLLSEINQLFIYGAQKQLSLYIDGYKKELEYLTNQIQQYIESQQG